MSFNYSKSSATFEKNLNIDSQNLDLYRFMCVFCSYNRSREIGKLCARVGRN